VKALAPASADPADLRDLARLIRSDDDAVVLALASRLAASIVGARQGAVVLFSEEGGTAPAPAVSLAAGIGLPPPWPPETGVGRLVGLSTDAERLTTAELAADPRYRERLEGASPPIRDLLAAPLTDPDGRAIGRIALSDPVERAFTDGHAEILASIADTVSAAFERRYLQARLEDARRQRQAFFGVVSHELRTPITTIYGGIRMLDQAGARLSHDTREQLMDDIASESERLYRLVEDLLVLSRSERGSLDVAEEPILLQHLIRRVAASEQQRRPTSRIRVDVGPDLPPVMGDSTLVEQVLRNYLSNALKYAGSDGPIEVSAAKDGHWVEVRVADAGPGIDADPPDQVFELFYRTPAAPSRAQGAGIGLYVCRELVQAMGGQTRVRAREPRGSEFAFRLRAYAEDEAAMTGS
jgi:K+-sensing histidine kinase KdpD